MSTTLEVARDLILIIFALLTGALIGMLVCMYGDHRQHKKRKQLKGLSTDKCPVESCHIRGKHSHAEALIDKLKGN